MKLIEVCAQCTICGDGLTPIHPERRLIQGDLDARTLVIMEWCDGWKYYTDRLMGDVPYAVTFAVRCSAAGDKVAQRVNCSIFTRILANAFDAFVIEGSASDNIFMNAQKEAGVTSTVFGPVVFIDSFGALKSAEFSRYRACIATMQALKSGRVLRKGVIQ